MDEHAVAGDDQPRPQHRQVIDQPRRGQLPVERQALRGDHIPGERTRSQASRRCPVRPGEHAAASTFAELVAVTGGGPPDVA